MTVLTPEPLPDAPDASNASEAAQARRTEASAALRLKVPLDPASRVRFEKATSIGKWVIGGWFALVVFYATLASGGKGHKNQYDHQRKEHVCKHLPDDSSLVVA